MHTAEIADNVLNINKKQYKLSEYHIALNSVDEIVGSWFLFNDQELLEFQCATDKEASEWIIACILGGATQI